MGWKSKADTEHTHRKLYTDKIPIYDKMTRVLGV